MARKKEMGENMSRDEELKAEMEQQIEANHQNVCQSLTNAYNTIGQKLSQIDKDIKAIPNSPDKIKELRSEMDTLKLNQEDLMKKQAELNEKYDKTIVLIKNLEKVATSYFERLEKDIKEYYTTLEQQKESNSSTETQPEPE